LRKHLAGVGAISEQGEPALDGVILPRVDFYYSWEPMSKIRILHAPENAAFAEKVADALHAHDFSAVLDTGAGAGDLDPRDEAAVIVIWSPHAVVAPHIIAEARDALARRMLVPVAVGRISPPASFEHVWPMDLAGWTGKADDPRWNFVLEEIGLAARRAEAARSSSLADEFEDGSDFSDADYAEDADKPVELARQDASATAHDRGAAQVDFNREPAADHAPRFATQFDDRADHIREDDPDATDGATDDGNRIAAPRRRASRLGSAGGFGARARAAMTPLAFVVGGLFGALMLGGAYLMGVFNAAQPGETSQTAMSEAGMLEVESGAKSDDGASGVVAYLGPAQDEGGGSDSPELAPLTDDIAILGVETTSPAGVDALDLEAAEADTERAENALLAEGDASSETPELAVLETPADNAPADDGLADGAPADISLTDISLTDNAPANDAPAEQPDPATSADSDAAVAALPAYTDQSFPATGGGDPIARLAMAATRDTVAANANLGNYFRQCVECPDMAALQAGSFMIGAPAGEVAATSAEGPQTPVSIPAPFAIGAREVTFDEWDACVRDGGCNAYRPSAPWGRGRQPAVNVSFADAQAYVDWLSYRTGSKYRLPTEAEWEYAARAGAGTAFSFGNAVSPQIANYHGEFPYQGPRGVFRGQTTQTGTFAPNAFGLYDMHGNTWEWTSDCWRPSHASGEAMCYARVVKGGAWNTGGWRLRAAHRNRVSVDSRSHDTGFRVVRELP